MKNLALWALVGLNALLLVVYVARATPSNAAVAQIGRAGDYVMIPGEVVGGGGTSVVYLVDTTNGTLAAIAYENNNIAVMPPIDLARLFEQGARGTR